MTQPVIELIPRTLDPEIQIILEQFAAGIDEVVNFGSQILIMDLQAPGGDEKIPVSMFFRNLLGLLDSIAILVRHSSIDPCKGLLRSALETSFYLEYLLEEDTERRSLAYMVWEARNDLKFYVKVDGESQQYKELKSKYKKDKFLNNSTPYTRKDIEEIKKITKQLLELDKYKLINAEYERVNSLNKDPNWYSLFGGPKNLEELAKRVKTNIAYEVLYRAWSGAIHGTDIIKGRLSRDKSGGAQIHQLRSCKDAQWITLHSFNIAIAVFHQFIKKRIPEKSSTFSEWYENIRSYYLQLGAKPILIVE